MKLSPESEETNAGVIKCRKTIINKVGSDQWNLRNNTFTLSTFTLSLIQIGEKGIFSFPGSRYFFDYLSREGPGGVDNYLHLKSSWKKSIIIINHANRNNAMKNFLTKAEFIRDTESQKVTKKPKSNVMKEDRDYFKSLEKNLLTATNQTSEDPIKSRIMKTVKNAKDFLQERELFWMYFD